MMFVKGVITNILQHQLRSHGFTGVRLVRCMSSSTDMSLTMSMLSQDKSEQIYIEAINQLGFKLNNKIRIIGPMVAFPKTLLQWNVRCAEDLTIDSFSLFAILEPKVDMLIVGVGDKGRHINPEITDYLSISKIRHQILPTNQAASLFNFLNREDRYVAAALIPPQTVTERMLEDSNLCDLASSTAGMLLGSRFMGLQTEGEESDMSLKDFDSSELKDTPIKRLGGMFGHIGEKGGFRDVSSDKEMAKRVSERLKKTKISDESDDSDKKS